jgi:hypothetical protein
MITLTRQEGIQEKIALIHHLCYYRRLFKMRTTTITAADIISQIEGKVNEKIIPLLKEAEEKGKEIEDETIESLKSIYTASYGPAFLRFYEEQGARIHGKSVIRTLIDLAKSEIESRRIMLDDASHYAMPQFSDRGIEDHLAQEHGLNVQISGTQYSAEDFRFGVMPYGYRPTDDKLGLDPEKAFDEVKKAYDPLEKPLEEILATLPRVHRMEHQSYHLDVEATLQESGITPHLPRYREIKLALTTERDDPSKQDQLRKLYAQAELDRFSKAGGILGERDDE